jgi:hypothetical protein
MTEYFYRYRPIKAVLDGFRELENQEIYFSTTDEINDPMEGFKDLFWLGDEIVWRNFLKHYILCVLMTTNRCFGAGEQFDPNVLRNIVFWVPQELPETPIQEVYQRVSTEFLAQSAVKTFLSIAAGRTTPIRRTELTMYLRALHGFALQSVTKEYHERGGLPPQTESSEAPWEELRRSAIAVIEGVNEAITSTQDPLERMSEALFPATERIFAQIMLLNEYNIPNRDISIACLVHRFPMIYVSALDRLVHPDWYVACFTKTAENHSMWSHYADGHRGVCLMFKTTANAAALPRSLWSEARVAAPQLVSRAPCQAKSPLS